MKELQFKEFTYEQEKAMINMKVGRAFISEEDIKKVIEILDLDNINSEEELRATRNGVVKCLGNATKVLSMLGDEYFKQEMQISTNMSGIVAVIDNKLFNMGCGV